MSDDYIKESPNIDILIKTLGFKPEIIEQLPEDYRRKLELVKDMTVEEIEKLISERKGKSPEKEEKPWKPECEPDAIDVKIQEAEPAKIVTPNLSDQPISIETGVDGKQTVEIEKPEKEVEKKPIDKKAIGKWGEKYVYKALKEKYEEQGKVIETDTGFRVINADGEEFEIIWLNKHQDSGEGYDFVIKKNKTDIEYIEVKTKTKEGEELIEVTGTQWEFARKLFDHDEGEKYFLYVVLNAGKSKAEIKKTAKPN